jgi:hypothetical protein
MGAILFLILLRPLAVVVAPARMVALVRQAGLAAVALDGEKLRLLQGEQVQFCKEIVEERDRLQA